MIIISHLRGRPRQAASYLTAQGSNEKVRVIEISDLDAVDLHEAFENMQKVASTSKVEKLLHHISINPCVSERLTDDQVLKAVRKCESKYGYKPDDHQRVIVEHVKGERQHFHVIWSRISMATGTAHNVGQHYLKSIHASREIEAELGLKPTETRHIRRILNILEKKGLIRAQKKRSREPLPSLPVMRKRNALPPQSLFQPAAFLITKRRVNEQETDAPKLGRSRSEIENAELLAWAWEHKRFDILQQFGIFLPSHYFDH